jgi:threonine/homoserine/homoserine lactone efflux protein
MDALTLYLPGILLAYSACFLGLMSPGPNILAVMGTSMSVNRKSGMALAMGVATGSFCWAVITASGLSALIVAYGSALLVIKIAGGLYLLWLAYKSFRAAVSAQDMEAKALVGDGQRLRRYFSRGFIVQMTNPKAAFSWIAIIALGMGTGAPVWVAAAIVVGTTALSIGMHAIYAVAFSTAPMIRIYAKGRRWIQTAMGAFFTVAGLKLLTSRAP